MPTFGGITDEELVGQKLDGWPAVMGRGQQAPGEGEREQGQIMRGPRLLQAPAHTRSPCADCLKVLEKYSAADCDHDPSNPLPRSTLPAITHV